MANKLMSILPPAALIAWLIVVLLLLFFRKKQAERMYSFISLLGLLLFTVYILLLWLELKRPPMRTLGETRMWYSFFLAGVGLVAFLRWKYKWFLGYALGMASLFLFFNLLSPENFSKTLMPALRSPWFVPHVIVYILAYALLAAAALVSLKGLYQEYSRKPAGESMIMADNMVYIGFSFLTLGLVFGALWAKEAWGHYWTWDPKETWAFLTWLGYLLYIHYRFHRPKFFKPAFWGLALAFVILLICWMGLNYLPTAASSVHVY